MHNEASKNRKSEYVGAKSPLKCNTKMATNYGSEEKK